MTVDRIIAVAASVLIALTIAVGGTLVLGACDDQDGGYPTRMVRSDAR